MKGRLGWPVGGWVHSILGVVERRCVLEGELGGCVIEGGLGGLHYGKEWAGRVVGVI